MSASSSPALTLRGIRHRFGRLTALDSVDLSIEQGEIVCLVGPSGCGKSTLLRVAAGLEDLQVGEVRIDGRVVADSTRLVPPERRGVGLVFQDYALFPHLSVLDNVRFGLSGTGSTATKRARALETLQQVGMHDYAQAFPHQLSGGQQQRVALARALAPNPGVMLLDEPFSNLDVRLRGAVRDQTLHVLKAAGTATMIVTHDPEEAMFMADRIALMRAGRLVQVGSPVDLYVRPVDAFAASFFGEVNRLHGRVSGGAVETPLGRLDAGGVHDGTDVDVLIRPEALVVSNGYVGANGTPQGVPSRVQASRLLGRSSLIHLQIEGGEAGPVHLHALVPGLSLPVEGSRALVSVDPNQAFVFPSTSIT